MAVPILIVSPSSQFGEHIRHSLEDVGGYQPVVAADRGQALAQLEEHDFPLMILDSDMETDLLAGLWQDLQDYAPGLRLVVIPPSEHQHERLLEILQADGYLERPLHATSLVETLAQVLDKPAPEKAPGFEASADEKSKNIETDEACELPWLHDSQHTDQELRSLSLETSAQASLILNQDQIWAYAGYLPRAAAQELAEIAARRYPLQSNGKGDLASYVRLESIPGEYILFATRLCSQMTLVLAYSGETPFSRVRAQAGKLVAALAAPPSQETRSGIGWEAEDLKDLFEDLEFEEDDEEGELPIRPLFSADEVPPPTPGAFHWEAAEQSLEQEEEAPSEEYSDSFWQPEQEIGWEEEFSLNRKEGEAQAAAEFQDDLQPDFDEPESTGSIQRQTEIDSAVYFELDYACALVPRLPRHHLSGDLKDSLEAWVRQIHLAFGWRLKHIAVHSDYLLWTSNTPPNTSPETILNVMRRQTSNRIFAEYDHLGRENPSGDFWAPGYFIMTTSQPPSHSLLHDFVGRTRRWQGINGLI